jgi:hypothetical protein
MFFVKFFLPDLETTSEDPHSVSVVKAGNPGGAPIAF